MQFHELAEFTGGVLDLQGTDPGKFSGVSIDSRSLADGELFVAIRGEQTDGHIYLSQAIDSGASGLVIEQAYLKQHDLLPGIPVVIVRDSHEAMLKLASVYLEKVAPMRIGITGSNGKTTTKEFLYSLLSAITSNVYKSPGNFNNLFGIPLALFSMPRETKIAVLEMGISKQGEMTQLSELVRPDAMLFTNIGPSHLEFLGSVEDVARAKLEALSTMNDDQNVIVNGDDSLLLSELTKRRPKFVTFGLNENSDFYPERIDTSSPGNTVVTIEGHRFSLDLYGQYQVYNLLAAYATVRALGFSLDALKTEDLQLNAAPMRGEIKSISGIEFIVDCYNANPESVKAGLKTFEHQDAAGRKIVILGDMLELGNAGEQYHRELGKLIAEFGFDNTLLVGDLCKFAFEEALAAGLQPDKILLFDDVAKCATLLPSLIREGDRVYMKASRSMHIESVLHHFEESKDNN